MLPSFWLTIQLKKFRIPIFLPLAFVFSLALEVIAILPLLIVAIIKRKFLFFRIAIEFYLTSLFFTMIFWGRKFKIRICERDNKISIIGKWSSKALKNNDQSSLCTNHT